MASKLRSAAQAILLLVVIAAVADEILLVAAVLLVVALRAWSANGFKVGDEEIEVFGLVFLVLVADERLVVAAIVLVNVLAPEKRLLVLRALVNGNSIRGTEAITGVHRDTIVRFVRTLGAGGFRLHNALVRDLACSFVEVDEQHSFVQVKQAHLRPDHSADAGDTWSWVAIDRASRLAVSFHVGKRDEQAAAAFIGDLRARLVVMPQISSDGLALYAPAIARAFGAGVDFATIVKSWNTSKRRRPAAPSGALLVKTVVFGEPDLDMATTAHDERLNLTMRHANGRLRRKCLAFSKTLASHQAAVALAYVHYNFCHVVRTLKTTPAVRAGIADNPWTLPEFMDAVLSAPPCDVPEAKPLRARTEDERQPIVRAPTQRKKSEPAAQLNLFTSNRTRTR